MNLWISLCCLATALYAAGALGQEEGKDPAAEEAAVPRYILDGIEIHGARRTSKILVRSTVGIEPGERFSADDPRLEQIRYRLLASGLFSHVTLSLRKGTTPHSAVLRIHVTERNTVVIRDLYAGITRIKPHTDTLVPFGAITVEERSLLGTGIRLGATAVGSTRQGGFQLHLVDNHVLGSDIGFHIRGLFTESREYFGDRFLPAPDASKETFGRYEVLAYRRAGVRSGFGYALTPSVFVWLDHRLETILAEEPKAAFADTPVSAAPPAVGYLEPNDSILSSLVFGVRRDTTNHPALPTDGSLTVFSIEVSTALMASSYDFSKYELQHTSFIPIGDRGQALALRGMVGLINGDTPFFNQFFVGDYSDFVPSRRLGINFSNLHPYLLPTSIANKWYEDMVASLSVEYGFPLYRGGGFLSQVRAFARAGVFALNSADHLGEGFPLDITANLGLYLDTRIGVVRVSFAGLLQMIGAVRRGTTQ